MLSILSNSYALKSANYVNNLHRQIAESAIRLNSNSRIVSAKDDPSGVTAISNIRAQMASYTALEKNTTAGMSLLENSGSALSSQQEILLKMKEIATEASSDLLSANDRTVLSNTFTQLQTQLDSIVDKATLFGQNLVGSTAADVTLQIGPNAGNTFTLTNRQSDAATLGVDAASIDIADTTNSAAAITAIDTAIGTVASNQGLIGAQQNGLEAISRTNTKTNDSLREIFSRINDVDVAKETANLYSLQARMDFSMAMQGIISRMPMNALALLR
jgi:flagellin